MVPPKAILFDIGGVCVCFLTQIPETILICSLCVQVVSPFQAILDYEKDNGVPVGYINFAIQKGPHDTGAWQQIERGDVILDDAWFQAFKAQLDRPESWEDFCQQRGVDNHAKPSIDAKKLFWKMMKISRTPDPYMYPALKKLRDSGAFVLGALSNTIAFPPGIVDDAGQPFSNALVHAPPPNPYANDSRDIRSVFDTFVSSAHVGLRKPDPKAYEYAVEELSKVAEKKGLGAVKANEVLFLDDIGVNLKWAKVCGLRTIKVNLGASKDAVEQLQRETGIDLGIGIERSKL
jgi:FMN phosphatase YigB (HAD superfamily)